MLITLSQKSDKPLYQQVIDQIRAQILSGQLEGGRSLPSIRALAKELTTSVITIKRAYAELEQEGLIYTRQGLGSFVSDLRTDEIQNVKRQEVETMLREGINQAIKLGLNLEDILQLVEELFYDGRD